MNLKFLRFLLPTVAAATIFMAGCSHPQPYYPPPPPPPPGAAVPPLVQMAEQNGFHAGVDNGARDAANGFGYAPRRGRAFHDAPGYDPNFGPHGPYVQYFRSAYMRGYDKGYYHR